MLLRNYITKIMDRFGLKYIIFLVALALFSFAMSAYFNAIDYDLWARLVVGAHFWQTFSMLKHDFLSYTPTHFWFDHEWGASVIFYLFFKIFGPFGFVVIKSLLVFAILFLVHKTNEVRYSKLSSREILYYVFVLFSAMPVFAATVRCHMFSFLFFTSWIYCLERYRKGEKKWIFYLPFSMILWANIHGGCVSGVGLLLIYAVGEFLNKKPIKDYFIAFFASVAALFVNPYGIGYVKFLFVATTMSRPMISEWHSSFDKAFTFSYLEYKAFLLTMFVSVVASLAPLTANKILSYIRKIDKTKLLLLIITAFLSVRHVKHQPFFVITAAIFLFDEFNFLIKLIGSKIRGWDKIVKFKYIISYGVVFLSSFFMIFCSGTFLNIFALRYPVFAVEFVKENKLKGNLLINFPYASYAVYKLYPNNLIFMDGRYEEVYDIAYLEQLRDFFLVKGANWDKVIKKYKTDVIVVDTKYKVYNKLKLGNNWTEVFVADGFAVFVPSSAKKTKYIYPPADLNFYNKSNFDTDIDFAK